MPPVTEADAPAGMRPTDAPSGAAAAANPVPLGEIARCWGRIGALGFGGPPAHIALLRELCVQRRGWIDEEQFEHGVAATNLLPGPASTQLAIFCAWRLRGGAGALVGGLAFILPGLALIIALAAAFLGSPPDWVRGAGAGAGAVVSAVALQAGASLVPGSWRRTAHGDRVRWSAYVLAGAATAVALGPWLVLVLVGCGLVELVIRRGDLRRPSPPLALAPWPALLAVVATGGLGALCWTALKVGALSYGGGFVIVPLMQADAVAHGWMTNAEFLNAVALGQATPGPVVQTIAVVGYAAHGLGGALLAALVAFAPSFWFIALGAARFDRLRTDPAPRAILAGAGPAAIGAILGSAVPLASALTERWQLAVLAGGAMALFVARRSVLTTLVLGAAAGIAAAAAGASLPA